MKKFLLGLLSGLAVAALVGLIGLLVLARLGDSKPTITEGALVMRLEGAIPEKPPMSTGLPFFSDESPVTVIDIWQNLERAAGDPRVKAVVLMPRGLSVGWAKLEEIRGDLVKFKKSGKPLYVFLRAPRTPEYYLATAADRIYMVPEDLLDMKGMRAEITYFKGALDKIGARLEAEHAGKYKDALDSFTRTDMSPETREVYNALLDGLYGHLTATIASARKMTPEQVAAVIDEGPFLANQAVAHKLVDATIYEDQFFDEVKKGIGGGELKKISFADYVKAAESKGDKKIAILVNEGAIIRGQSVENPLSEDDSITVAGSVKVLRQVAKDDSIAGVILRVDSPGGDAVASDEILREVELLSKKKPMVISMSDVAASGGYYIAMSGDPVLAYPTTITGSIGVIFGKVNLKGLYDKLGLTKDVVQRGRHATIDSEYYELSPEGKKKLREGVDEIYKSFVGIVAKSRKKKYEEIDALAQGRVWLGQQAKDRALVDELGGLDRAVALVRERAKIGAGESVRVMVYPPKRSLLEQWMLRSGAGETALAEASIRREVRQVSGGIPFDLWTGGTMLKLLPVRITAR